MSNQKGFTLIELVIALVISSIVIVAIYDTFISQEKVYTIQEQISEMQQNLRVGLGRMVNEIRMAGYDPTGLAGAGIVVADSDFVEITADLNGDGDTNDTDEDITYSLYDLDNDGDLDLVRNNQPLVENISNNGLRFRYFDGSGNELTDTPLDNADRAAVKRIEITLIAQTERPNPDTRSYIRRTLTSSVIPRNLAIEKEID